MGAATVVIGGVETVQSVATNGTISSELIGISGFSNGVTLDSGASLAAAQVLLTSNGTITFDARSTVDTIGHAAPLLDSTSGLLFALHGGKQSLAAASNGSLTFQASGAGASPGSGVAVAAGATIYSAGTLAFVTPKSITLSPSASLGATSFSATATNINIADASTLRPGSAPAGLLLTQQVLDTLLAGNPAAGVPGLQTLDLTASQSLNFFGSTQLNGAGLQSLVLNNSTAVPISPR